MKKHLKLALLAISMLAASESCLAGGFNVDATSVPIPMGPLVIRGTLKNGQNFEQPIPYTHPQGNLSAYISVDGPIKTIDLPYGTIIPQESIDLINQKINNEQSQAATMYIGGTLELDEAANLSPTLDVTIE